MYKNILEIDSKIRELFAAEKKSAENIFVSPDEDLTFWFKRYLSKTYPPSAFHSYDFYLIEVLDILKKYDEELFRPVVINFHKKGKGAESKKETIDSLVDEYNYIISLFRLNVPFSFKEQLQKDSCCPNSSYFLEDNDFFFCCSSCGRRFELDNITSNYGDCNRLIINHKNPHDRRNHFSECIDDFQGVQKYEIPEELLKKIEDHLETYKLVGKGVTRAERFSRVKKDHIKYVLKSLGMYKKCKEDVNIIYKVITNQSFPEINHLKGKLLDDFDIFDAKYSQLFPRTDQSAYHYYLILYQLLCFYNFPCNKSDFNFLKTAERKFSHELKYKQVFESLGWNYQSLF